MSDDALRPYDFSRLDDLYQYADRYNDLANYMCDELTMLEERAWQDADAQTLNDADAYLRKYVIATWRTLELDYAKEAGIRRSRVASFRQAVTLKVLLSGEDVEEDFLTVVSHYQRDVLLRKVAEASAPWLMKYDIKLDYDSEIQFGDSDWKIFIDTVAKPSRDELP